LSTTLRFSLANHSSSPVCERSENLRKCVCHIWKFPFERDFWKNFQLCRRL